MGIIMYEKANNKKLVYDLPTRYFHWLFTFLFLAAIIIAKTIDDDSALFSIHKLASRCTSVTNTVRNHCPDFFYLLCYKHQKDRKISQNPSKFSHIFIILLDYLHIF